MARRLPGVRVTGLAAGPHVIARLPDRWDPQDVFLERAAAAGIAVRPLSDHGTPAGTGVSPVLVYARLPPARIAEDVRLLPAEAVPEPCGVQALDHARVESTRR
jgi:GntR family transcriptional regulator/MocR family aminotransferase